MAKILDFSLSFKAYDDTDSDGSQSKLVVAVTGAGQDFRYGEAEVLPISSGPVDVYSGHASGQVQYVVRFIYPIGMDQADRQIDLVVDGAVAATHAGEIAAGIADTSLTFENVSVAHPVGYQLMYYKLT